MGREFLFFDWGFFWFGVFGIFLRVFCFFWLGVFFVRLGGVVFILLCEFSAVRYIGVGGVLGLVYDVLCFMFLGRFLFYLFRRFVLLLFVCLTCRVFNGF